MELTVLGDTTNKARQLARAGSSGKIFATKDMLGILTEEERARVHYGVRWSGGSRPDFFAPETFGLLANLAAGDGASAAAEFGSLAVAEIADLRQTGASVKAG